MSDSAARPGIDVRFDELSEGIVHISWAGYRVDAIIEGTLHGGLRLVREQLAGRPEALDGSGGSGLPAEEPIHEPARGFTDDHDYPSGGWL